MNPEKVSRYFKIAVDDLIDPFEASWANLRWLETFVWLAKRAWCVGEGQRNVFAVLCGHPGVIPLGVDSLGRRDWKDELARRFRYAISYQTKNSAIRGFRAANRLAHGNVLTIPGPHVASDTRTQDVNTLLGEHGWLAWSLNTSHPMATKIQCVKLCFDMDGCSAELIYGYPSDSSSWGRTLASQKTGEPLLWTLRRAVAELDRLKDPEAKPPMVERWAAHGGRPAARAMDAKCRDWELEPDRNLFWWRYTYHPMEDAL